MMGGADRQAAMKEGEIGGGGMRFRYRDAGAGPALVCLGGAAQRAKTRTLLAERYRVVELLLDDAPPPPSAAIIEAVAALGITRCDLIASGAKDALALALALEHPEKIGALVLLGPRSVARHGEPARGMDQALIERLGALKLPSLAVFGTKDALAPVEAARHYRTRIPGCNLVLLYDASEAMEGERPEALAALLLDFLERHDLFLVRRESDLLYP